MEISPYMDTQARSGDEPRNLNEFVEMQVFQMGRGAYGNAQQLQPRGIQSVLLPKPSSRTTRRGGDVNSGHQHSYTFPYKHVVGEELTIAMLPMVDVGDMLSSVLPQIRMLELFTKRSDHSEEDLRNFCSGIELSNLKELVVVDEDRGDQLDRPLTPLIKAANEPNYS